MLLKTEQFQMHAAFSTFLRYAIFSTKCCDMFSVVLCTYAPKSNIMAETERLALF